MAKRGSGGVNRHYGRDVYSGRKVAMRAGDIVYRDGHKGHMMVYVGSRRYIHNTVDEGVTVDRLPHNPDVFLIYRPPTEEADAVLGRAIDQIGDGYSKLFNNCEDVATRSAFGRASSPQRAAAIARVFGWGAAITAGVLAARWLTRSAPRRAARAEPGPSPAELPGTAAPLGASDYSSPPVGDGSE